jgi:hypothetical protein
LRAWPAILVAPLLASASISIGYGLVSWACRLHHPMVLHASILVFLGLTIVTGVYAWIEWRHTGPGYGADRGHSGQRAGFVALMAMASSGFFSLVILGQWLTLWLVPVCQY